MSEGGTPGSTMEGRRQTRLPCPLPGARLFALGASLALHLLGIAALANFLGYRPDARRDHAPTLTVVSLAPAPPRSPPAQPHPHGPLPAPLPETAPAATIPAIRMSSGSNASPVPPETPEPGKPAEAVVPYAESGAAAPATAPGSALRDYQAALWRRIDANRPRGVNMGGTTHVRFRLSVDGTLISAEVSGTSGNVLLDKIALRSVRRAAPFPRAPEGIRPDDLAFEIPIRFH